MPSKTGNRNQKKTKKMKRTLSKKSKKVRQLEVKKIMTDEEIKKREGDFFREKDFQEIINENCDVFYRDGKRKVILARFRKNVIPDTLSSIALEELEESSKKKHDNRGAAAGALDLDLLPKYVNRNHMVKRSKYVIRGYESLKNGNMVSQIIGNPVSSNIIGFYDKPDRNLGKGAPQCRLTQFNKNHMEKFQRVTPFLEAINRQFKKLMPREHKKQLERARKTDFVIGDTAFSTVTINHNWRTALHCDSGDFKQGFGNLTVIERGKYSGGYTVFPQFGVGVDVRSGDFLAMDVHQWHSNTPIYEKEEDKEYNDKLEKVYNDNPEVGTVGLDKKYTRLTFVCYLREKILNCPNEIDDRFLGPSGHGKII